MSQDQPPPPVPPPPGSAPAGAPSQPYPPGWPAAPQTNGMAVASMVLGIVGILMIPVLGPILALVFGFAAKGSIDRSQGREGGRSMAVAGIVLGFVGLATSGLLIAYFVWFFNHFDEAFREILRSPFPTPS